MNGVDFDVTAAIGLTAAPLIIAALVAIIKPPVRLVWPHVDLLEDSPWRFFSIVIGAAWVVSLRHGGVLADTINNDWIAAMVGIAVGLGSGPIRDGVVAITGAKDRDEGQPAPDGTQRGPVEPTIPPYSPIPRSAP